MPWGFNPRVVTMIRIKTKDEQKHIAESCRMVGEVLALMGTSIEVGITTAELDRIAEDAILKQNGVPAFKGYHGYPATICASINNEVVHGIPGNRRLNAGEIISIDVGVKKKGYFGDAARTFTVGAVDEALLKLLKVTEESLLKGIAAVRPGNRIKDISVAVQQHAEKNGFSVVRDLVGHGVGCELHEDPQIPNFAFSGPNPRIEEGMTFAIEPMINIGSYKVKTLKDGWTCVTADNLCSAHFEDTVIVTKDGSLNLTRTDKR